MLNNNELYQVESKPENTEGNVSDKQNNIEEFLVNNAEMFLYTDLQKIIGASEYVGEINLKAGVTARIIVRSGIINIVVKGSNGEVFNGIWSNLSYDKIVENAGKVFDLYNQ